MPGKLLRRYAPYPAILPSSGQNGIYRKNDTQLLRVVKAQRDADLAMCCGEVWLLDALAVRYPNAVRKWGWQYVFPAAGFAVDPRSGAVRRHHLDKKRMQRAMWRGAQRV